MSPVDFELDLKIVVDSFSFPKKIIWDLVTLLSMVQICSLPIIITLMLSLLGDN